MGQRNDTPTCNIAFIERQVRDRKLMILHQQWLRPNGSSYWREVGKQPSSVLEEQKHAAAALTGS